MVDQEADKKADAAKRQSEKVTEAVQRLSETEDGVMFFRWLKEQCHYHRSTISGDPQSFDVNTLGSIAQEFQRALYLKVRRGFTRTAKIKIEVE